MPSHVYILAHSKAPRIKIGKADDIVGRARVIGVDEFDFRASIGLRVDTSGDAEKLERLLHRAFGAWRITSEVVTADGGAVDGCTEWFRADCMNRLRQFVEHNRDLLGFTEVEFNEQPTKRSRGRPLAGDEPRSARMEYRTTPSRKAKLEAAAAAEGISVAAVMDRLVDSLERT